MKHDLNSKPFGQFSKKKKKISVLRTLNYNKPAKFDFNEMHSFRAMMLSTYKCNIKKHTLTCTKNGLNTNMSAGFLQKV